ncbi:MAG: ABC transporter ATP-binding protein [Desulfobacterales bacterium]|nr:ABC transporter ATP-binding protein [Desulfobacterales bacterium]
MIKYYKQFFTYFGRGYKRYIPLVVLGAAIAGVLEIAGLLLLLPFIRLLVKPDSFQKYPWLVRMADLFGFETPLQHACLLGGLIVVVFVAKNLYLVMYHFWQNRFLRRWKIDISTSLMRFYLFAPYKLHLEKTTERITRNVNNLVVNALNNFIFQGFMLISNVIAGLIILSLLVQRFFLFAVVSAVVLTVTSFCQYYFLKRKLKALGKEKNQLMSAQYKNIFQGLHAIKETKVLGREQFFLDGFLGVNQSTMNNDMWTMFYNQLPPYITEVSAVLCVVIMSIGIIHSTLGDNPAMMASLGFLAAIAFRTSSIVNRTLKAMQQITHSQHAIELLLGEVTDPLWQEYEQVDKARRISPKDSVLSLNKDICFEGVSFTYPNAKRPALKNINVRIAKGEFIGIVGKSGAGKTTFVDILLGLLEPDEGRILIDGISLTIQNITHWQKRLGYVPQQVYISNDTAIRNVAFGIGEGQVDIARVESVLKKANLYDHLKKLPEGLETPLGENGRRLSGGQKQRVGIARALYHYADVLVLDEATSSLDVPTEGKITEAINALKGQQTIIAIAHRLSTLKSCDRILYFDKRKLVDTGTFESLSEKYEKFAQMIKLSKI